MPRLTNKAPKEKVITLNKYERFWETSTPTGHQITIYSQDNTLLTINCNWPKDYYPRLHTIDKERYGKRSTQRVKKKSKSTRRGKKKRQVNNILARVKRFKKDKIENERQII